MFKTFPAAKVFLDTLILYMKSLWQGMCSSKSDDSQKERNEDGKRLSRRRACFKALSRHHLSYTAPSLWQHPCRLRISQLVVYMSIEVWVMTFDQCNIPQKRFCSFLAFLRSIIKVPRTQAERLCCKLKLGSLPYKTNPDEDSIDTKDTCTTSCHSYVFQLSRTCLARVAQSP